jgi:hypothetical protein
MCSYLALLACLAICAEPPRGDAKSAAPVLQPDPEWREFGRNLWFDAREKRAILRARVVLREGVLEHLMCAKGTKEHEAILATDAPPRGIHTVLILTGAEPGHPVKFLPKFEPPAGAAIAIELHWRENGEIRKTDARQWVWDEKTKTPLAIDWVFAGSMIYEDPVTKKPAYAADEGDLITVANFGGAILDVPMASSASDSERVFSAHTAKVPPIGTEVFMILAPRRVKSGAKSVTGANRRP